MSGEDDLPPELRAAWEQREREAAEPDADADGGEPAAERPADDAEAPAPSPASRPSRRAPAWRGFVLLPVAVGVVALVAWLGIAGWRGGPLFAAVLLVGTLVPLAVVVTRRVPMRWAYVAGTAAIAVAGIAVAVDFAPMSHGRVAERVDRVTIPFSTVRTERSGHGWCMPTCPRVTKEFRVEGREPTALYEVAVVALDAAGLVPRDARRSFLARALSYERLGRGAVIDHQSFTTVVRLRDEGDDAVVEVEVTSRRGFREQPEAPRSLAG